MNWLEVTGRMKSEGRFRWYTMTELANFLNSRKQVNWELSEDNGVATLEATHPQSLEHLTWLFPAARYAKPKIVRGVGEVKNSNDEWIVTAGNCAHLEIQMESLVK
jgi:hypothetical protein